MPELRETERNQTENEHPLPAAHHGFYLFGATALIAAFYLYCALSLILGGIAWVLLLIVSVFTIQYSGITYLNPYVIGLGAALKEIARSLRLAKGSEYQIQLPREEAPALWAEVESLAAQIQVAPPREILLEVGLNAWVHLKGVVTGRGHARLGVGYDMIAGLSTAQLRAVLAHEMAHAKHVRRGYQGFVMRGLGRLGRCSGALRALANDKSNGNRGQAVAAFVAVLPEKIHQKTSLWLAACSRYDEFLADRVSAEICGIESCQSALMATHVLDFQVNKLNWRERLLQIDREPGYTAWLQSRLHLPDDDRRLELEARALARSFRHELSTHPALPDRLAALARVETAPAPGHFDSTPASAITWIADSDATARRLLLELEKIAAEDERKATAALARWMRKKERARDASLHYLFGMCLCFGFGLLFTWAWWYMAHSVEKASDGGDATICLVIAAGCYLVGALTIYNSRAPRMDLPFPTFVEYRAAQYRRREKDAEQRSTVGELKDASTEDRPRLEAAQDEITARANVALAAQLRAECPPPGPRPRQILNHWLLQARQALTACDYERAEFYARFALEAKQNHPDALMVFSLCRAFFGSKSALDTLEESLKNRSHFNGQWASAWCGCLLHETAIGEAYLLELTRRRADVPLLWALLGYCQECNNKLRESLASRRKALELAIAAGDVDDEACHRYALARNLTVLRQMSEAKAELDWLEHHCADGPRPGIDAEALQKDRLRWLVAAEKESESRELCAKLLEAKPEPANRLELADIFFSATTEALRAMATAQYQALLEEGHYPQAYQALSRFAFDREEKAEARQLILQAINAIPERPAHATHPLSLLDDALQGLRAIDDPNPCRVEAWLLHLDPKDTPLKVRKLTLLCLYPTQADAEAAATEVFSAILPEWNLDSKVTATRAPEPNQPENEVPPGIYDSHWQ